MKETKNKIHFIYENINQELQQLIFNFWVKNDAVASVDIALKRLPEVFAILVNENSELIGEASTYLDKIEDETYCFLRIYIEQKHLGNFLPMQELTRSAFKNLKKFHTKAKGIAIVLENEKLAKLGKDTNYFKQGGYTYYGENSEGKQIWFVDFNNPQGIYKNL